MDILIDANIILDVFFQRSPFYEKSLQILQYCENGRVEGFVSAHSVTTMGMCCAMSFPLKSAGKCSSLSFRGVALLQLVKVNFFPH